MDACRGRLGEGDLTDDFTEIGGVGLEWGRFRILSNRRSPCRTNGRWSMGMVSSWSCAVSVVSCIGFR